MCKLCDEGIPQIHSSSRRDFLKATAATGVAAAGANLFAARPAAAADGDVPADTGRRGRRYIIRGGSVMSMDPNVGDFPQADVLVEGKTILAVGPNLHAGGAAEIDARGRGAFWYLEGAGLSPGPDSKYPDDAIRIKKQFFSSNDQLVTMIMGGEIYLPGYERAWQIGRQLGLEVAAHILSPFGMRPTFDLLAQGHGGGSGPLGIRSEHPLAHTT